jgi:hypothetical protein
MQDFRLVALSVNNMWNFFQIQEKFCFTVLIVIYITRPASAN